MKPTLSPPINRWNIGPTKRPTNKLWSSHHNIPCPGQ